MKRVLIACLLVLSGCCQTNDPPHQAKDSYKQDGVLPFTRDVATTRISLSEARLKGL